MDGDKSLALVFFFNVIPSRGFFREVCDCLLSEESGEEVIEESLVVSEEVVVDCFFVGEDVLILLTEGVDVKEGVKVDVRVDEVDEVETVDEVEDVEDDEVFV